MPFLAKMTSRLRGTPKDESKSNSVLSKSRVYLDSEQEARDKPMLDGSRGKLSRKESRGKYEDFSERVDKNVESNGHHVQGDEVEEEEDPDLLYRRSRDHFGSWDIRDITRNKTALEIEDKKSKGERKSRFDLFKSNGVDDPKKSSNGEAVGKHRSVLDVSAGDRRFESDNRNKYNKSRSPDAEGGDRHVTSSKVKSRDIGRSPTTDKTRRNSPSREKYRDKSGGRSLSEEQDNNHRGKNRSALLAEIENFGSTRGKFGKKKIGESPERSVERRYAGDRSPELENDKIRSLIERFKSGEEKNEARESIDRQRQRSVNRENGDRSRTRENRVKNRAENYEGDGFGSMDRRRSARKSDDWEIENYRSLEKRRPNGDRSRIVNEAEAENEDREMIGKKWTIDDRESKGKYGSVDRRRKSMSSEMRNGDYQETLNDESRNNNNNARNRESADFDFRKRSDTYSIDRDGRRKSREPDEDETRDSWSRRRSSQGRENGSPEDFDVQIHRYERALTSPRRDLDSGRRTSPRDRGAEVERRSSVKLLDDKSERNGRHARPLTPPEDDRQDRHRDRKKSFSTKEWYDSNKKFATRYLEENSKARPIDDRYDLEGNVKDVRRSDSHRETKATYFGDSRNHTTDENNRTNRWSTTSRTEPIEPTDRPFQTKTVGQSSRSFADRRGEINTRGEPITIKIRTVSDDREEEEKRSKRIGNVAETDDSSSRNRRRDDDHKTRHVQHRDKDWTSGKTPSRKIWNYSEEGVQIAEVDEGQPCLQCEDLCSGFVQHPWRKNCTNCKCPREAHDVCHEEWVSVRSRLGLKGDGASNSNACDPRELGLAWVPPGLPTHKVKEYFSMLPEISVPKLGTPGERYRDRQLAMQLPKQDLAKAYCRHLAPEHYMSADDFMAARNEIALDIGTVQEVFDKGATCAACKDILEYGSIAVSAGKLDELYHPACFQCFECRELLVDLAYCVYNDDIFCERHYAEKLKGRCAACDELIFSGEFTRAMNKDWHSGHFCCWQCDESLTGQRYVLRDEHPYCIKCYESVFANTCEECNKIIGIDSKDLSYKDKHWHEACFLCNKCRVSLVDKQFGSKVDKIYCGNCYDSQFASRCDGCGEIFRAGTKKMEYKTRQWHEKCFCCVVCKNAIGTKSFIPREQEIYCAGCYEDKFATRCVKCNKIITSGGVTYKNEPWHRECFTCSNCNTSLAGQRFTSRDEKPYCADCFGELFAKRCTACTKPITGIGGTRFISFEDRHWHNDCFICAGCKTSLVGRGFITDAEDIICPECAKQKLM